MDDLHRNCQLCHEITRAPSEHHCGRTPEGTLPAHQPHRAELFLTDAEIDDFLATIHGEDHT